jgi:hypothetical protein
MSGHGFERIDVVLEHLAKEMDASIEKQLCRHAARQPYARRPSEHANVVDGNEWANTTNFGALFDRMNAQFETVAKHLRQFDKRMH